MNCREIETENIGEKYALGQLTEQERVAYEEHYFDCPNCFQQLQILQSTQQALKSQPRPSASADWRWVAAAAALVVATGLIWQFQRPAAPVAVVPEQRNVSAPENKQLLALAKFDPPVYREAVTRGTPVEAEALYRAAMKLYAKGEYQPALTQLEIAVKAAPTAPAPRFYLGICQLVQGQGRAAEATFAKVAALGDTPFLELAQYHRAKAFLQLNDRAHAQAELRRVVALHGDWEQKAKELLTAIDQSQGAAR